jgi:hypothetical protein
MVGAVGGLGATFPECAECAVLTRWCRLLAKAYDVIDT